MIAAMISRRSVIPSSRVPHGVVVQVWELFTQTRPQDLVEEHLMI